MRIVEADASDGPRLCAFFLDNPVGVGTDFVLDRSPDFNALLRLRGRFRTFCACEGERLVGVATALWDERKERDSTVLVGEFADLRVAATARGGRAARQLLAAVVRAFDEAGVEWMCAVIGDDNRAARSLVEGKAGLPRIAPLTPYVSVHIVALRTPLRRKGHVTIRTATEADTDVIGDAVRRLHGPLRLAPAVPFDWPDPTGRHRAWIAAGANGEPIGGLVVWDGDDVRRVRVVRYAGADRLLRLFTQVLSRLRLVASLPPPGGALSMWASRALWNDEGSPAVTRALIAESLRTAAASGVHVVQLNLPAGDALLGQLPAYPRSTFRSTLFGARRDGVTTDADGSDPSGFYADLSMV